MANITTLWDSKKEDEWHSALGNYWNYVMPNHVEIEKEFYALNSDTVKEMNPKEWYEFLLKKYFFWKYTAPNRYATTTANLKKYESIPSGFDQLFKVKQEIFDFDKEDIAYGLKIANEIKGLGTAGASGLLAVLFPLDFGTVDQFAVKSLFCVDSLQENTPISLMNPEQLKLKDAIILITIMRHKAAELNNIFMTTFWTPRKIDMILWSVNR